MSESVRMVSFQPLVLSVPAGQHGLVIKDDVVAPSIAWLRAGIAVAAVGWGANQFAPLLLEYRSRLGLSAATVEATFGLYALGLIPGLLLGGPVSDRFGRRPVLLPALAMSLLGTGLLIAGGWSPGWLFAGRLVAGVESGTAFSSGAAWIKELSPAGGPRRITIAMTTGFAAGPLVAGMLAQWAPAPAVLPYVPHLLLTLVAVPLVLRTPDTLPRRTSVRLRLPDAVHERRFRTVVVPLAPWVFGSASIALAYLPGLVAGRLGGHALVFSAVNAMLTALAGILVQPFARRAHRLVGTASVIVVAGLLIASAAAATTQPALVVVAGLVLGAGYGCCQVAGLTEVQGLAGPDDLAGLTAFYQALSYLGFAAPFVLAALQHAVPPAVLLLTTAALATLMLAFATGATRPRSTR